MNKLVRLLLVSGTFLSLGSLSSAWAVEPELATPVDIAQSSSIDLYLTEVDLDQSSSIEQSAKEETQQPFIVAQSTQQTEAASIEDGSLLQSELTSISDINGSANTNKALPTFKVLPDDEEVEAQVTSVSQLSDVQPDDWAFQAIQSLVERYGCVAGYPDGTFRPGRAISRREAAALVNACLDNLSNRFATKEDLDAAKALQDEFAAELATLRGRVDGLEARVATVEAQQFSTTTKLVGEAIMQTTRSSDVVPIPAGFATFADIAPNLGLNIAVPRTGDNITANYRTTLSFITSFSGKDLLITSLQQGSFPTSSLDAIPGVGPAPPTLLFPTAQGALAPSLNQASDNNLALYYLGYRFPFAKDKGTFFITLTGGELSDFTDTLNPYFDSDGEGALSAFGIRNPIYRPISGRFFRAGTLDTSGVGAGLNFDITDKVNIALGYLTTVDSASRATDPGPNDSAGLFSDDYSAIAQLTFKPSDALGLGLTYVRTDTELPPFVSIGGGTGTFRSNSPFFFAPTSAHSVGMQFAWQPSSRFALSGWGGATFARAEAAGATVLNDGSFANVEVGDDATILNFALLAAFPDLFVEGNLGGLIFGIEPQVFSSSIADNTDPDTNFHIEALYKFKVNDNISVTPGIIAIINPEGNSDNEPIIVGTVRATFNF